MFDNYLYVSGTSKTFVNHCDELALSILEEYEFEKTPSVLDVACNDGTLLECFRDRGCNILGIDPALNLKKITREKGIAVLPRYFSDNLATNIKESSIYKAFDIITATNVFAHVHNCDDFLRGMYRLLKPNGVIVIEFPYCKEMIENNEFDTIYHEHLSYFTIMSFMKLVNRVSGLEIDRVEFTPIHGGSVRFYLQRAIDNCGIVRDHDVSVYDLIDIEKNDGIHNVSYYGRFHNRCVTNSLNLLGTIELLRKQNIDVVGFGASAKGNTMLNFCQLKYPDIKYIVDNTEAKHGYFTPGSDIPIIGIDRLKMEQKPVAILMTAWNFKEEIIKRINESCSIQHKYLYYVPEVKLI